MKIRSFNEGDEDAVVNLWSECGLTRPWNNPRLDIVRKLSTQADWFLVGELDGSIIGSAMFGYDGHRGWVNYLAVSPSQQRNGFARLLMHHGEELLKAAGCPKINLQIRSSNNDVLQFYQGLGYQRDDVVSYGKRLIADS
jgi:ribosomal protein S18 acetylase RimI-like enzyme